MSLQKTKIVDETIHKLGEQALELMNYVARLSKALYKGHDPSKSLLKNLKKLAAEIAETCEELP